MRFLYVVIGLLDLIFVVMGEEVLEVEFWLIFF